MNPDIVTHLFLDIPFHLDVPALLKRIHLKEDSRNAGEFLQLASEAAELAKPKAFYLTAYIFKSRRKLYGDRRFLVYQPGSQR